MKLSDKNAITELIKASQLPKSEDELIKRYERILLGNYLSEIERIQSETGFNRKELAQKIATSASYLTQVFRGDKPLNIRTIIKIQRALKIRFKVEAVSESVKSFSIPVPNTIQMISNSLRKNDNTIKTSNEMYAIPGGNTRYLKVK